MGDNARSYDPGAFGIAAAVFWWAAGLFMALASLGAVFIAPLGPAMVLVALMLMGLMLLLRCGRRLALWLDVEEEALYAITLAGPRRIGWDEIGGAVFWTDPETYQKNVRWGIFPRPGGSLGTGTLCDGVTFIRTGRRGQASLLAVDEHMVRDARCAVRAICERAGIEMPSVWVPPLVSRLARSGVAVVVGALILSGLPGFGMGQALGLWAMPPAWCQASPLAFLGVRLIAACAIVATAGAFFAFWTVVWEVFSHARGRRGRAAPTWH